MSALPNTQTPSAKRQLVNFVIKDCGLRRLHGGKLQRLIREVLTEIDVQNLRDTYPCPSFRDRSQMYQYVAEVCIKGGPIDYLEFGVFQGDSIRQWVKMNRHEDSRFFGFDSFEGLPENWRPKWGKGHFHVAGVMPQIDDRRVHFLKGWFDKTIPEFVRTFKKEARLLMHLDADLYGSTMLPLVHFSPSMTDGTLLIFDEFYDRDHEYKALMDWQKIFRRNFRIIAQTENYGKICIELL